MKDSKKAARLLLNDGSVFSGFSFGAAVPRCGEVVFNTGMVGYPETLTDPSYRGQILVFTYPLIGNYGVPRLQTADGLQCFFESDRIQIEGMIVSDYSFNYSHWQAEKSLAQWLMEFGIPGIYGIDTRALTRLLRNHGTMPGKIVFEDDFKGTNLTFEDPNARNLVAEVSVTKPVEYGRGSHRIIVVDCGVKNNIIRAFLKRDITVIRVPWDYDFTSIKASGILISNGPGDPTVCQATINHVRKAFSLNTPILGICLGSQILGLAAGAKTYKLKFGHRGQNQPCEESGTNRCYITAQNHGFAVNTETLPEDWRPWFINNNDQTNEGIIHVSKPFFGTQFHPEASPGPDDTEFLFDMFIRAVRS